MSCGHGDKVLKVMLTMSSQGLNKELGRNRGKEGKVEWTLCGAECKSVVHVLWEYLAYGSCR